MNELLSSHLSAVIPNYAPYALATGSAAVRRLGALHGVYSPFARAVLARAGLRPGMSVVDFGCGVGMTTHMLAEMVGPTGSVTGVDFSMEQVEEARAIFARAGISHASFVQANACETGLPRASFDFAYCRFLLLHLPNPTACITEMLAVLKPGGTLVLEDGDLTTAQSQPDGASRAFAELFGKLGPTRGLDYSMAKNLRSLVEAAGISDVRTDDHQPTCVDVEHRQLLKWSVEEAGSAFVGAGLISQEELASTVAAMHAAAENADVAILAPRMYFVSCVKP